MNKKEQKKNKKKPLWIVWLEYIPVVCIWYTIYLLPFRVKIFLGKVIGFITFLLLKNYREVVRCNLKIAFPQLNVAEQNKLIKESFLNFSYLIMEFLGLYALSKKAFVKKCVLNQKTLDSLEQIKKMKKDFENKKNNKGVIIYSSHLGSYYWNLFLLNLFLNESHLWQSNFKKKISKDQYLTETVQKIHMIVRKLDNPLINQKMGKLFQKGNIEVIERGGVFLKIKQLLKNTNGIVCIMVDQNSSRGSLYVPFFGKNASTMEGPFHLYQQTKATSYFMSNYRKDNKIHFNLEPISSLHKDSLSFFAELNSHIEKAIRQAPGQYLWLHPRWKKQKTTADYIYGKLKV